MSRYLKIVLAVFLALALASPAMAMKFDFHGDFNNRFLLYTDQAGWFSGGTLDKEDRNDTFGEIKYRLWTTAATDDGAVKGVFAIEVGAIKFGAPTSSSPSITDFNELAGDPAPFISGPGASARGSTGGSFSGDGVNIETRWFYLDFQIPSIESKARVQMGLLPFSVNEFFWSETAMGVKFYTDSWYLAWIRGRDSFPTSSGDDWGDNDLDSINARYDLKMEPVKVGVFASYLWQNVGGAGLTSTVDNNSVPIEVKLFPDKTNFDLLAVGIDGGWSTATSFGKAFVNWDLLYETGGVDDVGSTGNDFDISAYLLHGDFGLNFGATTVTYTVWYASGDDNSSDKDFENFMSVDVDFFDSFIFQESLTDDNAFFEGPYIRDKGMFFNKLALDYQASKKAKLGLAVLYLLTAEDLEWTVGTTTFKEDALGVEIDGYGSYKLYDNLELRLNLAYLIADDAMDFFERPTSIRDGSADVDIFKSEARVRFQF